MSSNVLDQETQDGLPRLSDVDAAYGVKVNALSVDELFALYERTGFLYPAKAARLIPHLDRVRENWRRLLCAGDKLLYVLTAGDEKQGTASIAAWRTTSKGWTSQHLVAQSNPMASRSVMLAGVAASMLRGVDESSQNWFRPENRFPSRVFGSMVQTVGDKYACVRRHMYFAMPRSVTGSHDRSLRVVAYDPSHQEALCALVVLVRGSIYLTAEELRRDVNLRAVDDMYRTVGLKRTRRVWLVYQGYKDEPIGAAIAYRGPLGVNFSYIENRCDLLIHPTLPESEVSTVVAALLNACSAAYADFELDEIPVIADQIAAPALGKLGAELLRHYCQGIWLKDGQPRFYRHVDQFYARLLARNERHMATLAV